MNSFGLVHRSFPRGGKVAVAGLLASLLFMTGLEGSAIAKDESAKGKPRTWHASSFGSGRAGYRILNYWSKGPDMRTETLIVGHPVVTIIRGDRYIVLDMLLGKGVEIQRSASAVAEDKTRDRPFANEYEKLIAENGEKIDEEVIAGTKAEVWRLTDSAGRRTIWVTASEPRVPRRIESFDRATGNTVTIDYSNWIFDLEIPDAFFVPAAGFEIETYGYDDYVAKSLAGTPDPAPIFYPHLLHGARPR